MKRFIVKILVAVALLVSQQSMAACNFITEFDISIALTTIKCSSSSKHETASYAATFWGSWKKISTDKETGKTTDHVNGIWSAAGVPSCKIEAWVENSSGVGQKIGQKTGFCL